MSFRLFRFLATVTAFLAVSSAYVGSRIIAELPPATSHPRVVWLTLASFVILQFAGPLLYRALPSRRRRLYLLHWITYATLGVFACVLFYTLAADVVVIVLGLTLGPGRADGAVFACATALVLATIAIGFPQAALGPRIYRVDVPLPSLPRGLDGFRIAQISDLHIGPLLGRRYAQKVVRMVNALSADAIALTGDFVDGRPEELRESVQPLAELRAKHGVFFITGNHEYYSGVDAWIREFRLLGARPLLNEHVLLRNDGAELVIAGITDFLPDYASAVAGAPAGAVKLLLAHHPEGLDQASAAGFDLQLSGHTHGGQFFPFSVLVRLRHRYYKGLYRVGKLWLYVSRGTGYWGPPLRFGVPSEITLITLKNGDRPPS
jgi:predicted MPP superfamily phosphohydrolase